MDITGFNALRLAALYQTFGEPAEIGGLSCVVCAGAHRGKGRLDDGGTALEFSRTVRCRMADFSSAPKEGEKVTIGGRRYRVEEVTADHHAGEYILGLEQMR